jgi:NAD+ synthase
MKSYQTETEQICKFISDYVKESKTKGIVLGVSGGLDSAVVAVLSVKAIGKENVHLFYYPYKFKPMQSDIDKQHIDILCKKFGLTYETRYISHIVDEFTITKNSKLVRGNIMSRTRMIKLYQQANERNCIVLGTTNRSEWLTGYFTKHGDGACDFEPIMHLYKTEIFGLARSLGIPDALISKKPSAGLWDGQTDEHELGITYKKLDRILMLFGMEEGMFFPIYNIERYHITTKDINMVAKLVNDTKHKRRLPLCPERG